MCGRARATARDAGAVAYPGGWRAGIGASEYSDIRSQMVSRFIPVRGARMRLERGRRKNKKRSQNAPSNRVGPRRRGTNARRRNRRRMAVDGAREDWTRIHGVDQRAAFVEFRHDALRRASARGAGDGPSASRDGVRARQRGSACADFAGDTSSVVWPIALRACARFCDATGRARGEGGAEGEGETRARTCARAREMVITRETRVLELGSGIGVLGMVLARLGAARVTMSDANVGVCEANANEDGAKNLETKTLLWARKDGECWREVCEYGDALEASGGLPHLIVGTDLLYSQTRETFSALADTVARLSDEHTAIVIGYEDRGDWESLATFWDVCEEAGLFGEAVPFSDDDADDDLLLIRLRKETTDRI